MSVFDRRRADELAAALERAAATPAATPPATPAAAPAATAPAGASAAVALAQRLRDTGTALERTVAPRPEFRAALRTRLVAVATVQPVTAPPSATRSWRSAGLQKGAAVAAGALASVVAVSGVAVASSEALPGEPFYGVKRAAEDVQLRLAGDATAEGTRHLQFAATRMDEVAALTLGRDGAGDGDGDRDGPDWELVRRTLADMDGETVAGTRLLEQAWRDSGDRAALTALSGFAAEQAAALQALLPALAPTVLDAAQASLGLVNRVAEDTEQMLAGGVCGPGCTRGTAPGATDPSCDCPATRPGLPGADLPSLAPTAPPLPEFGSTQPPAGEPSSEPSDDPSGPPAEPSPSPSGDAPPPLTPLPSVPAPSPSPTPLVTPLPSAPVTTRLPALDPSLPSLSPTVGSPDADGVLPDLPTG